MLQQYKQRRQLQYRQRLRQLQHQQLQKGQHLLVTDKGCGNFMLGFQTQTQSDMAIKYVDKDIMLMDATFGTNQREMALYTALGIDNFGNGVPVFRVLTHVALHKTGWI